MSTTPFEDMPEEVVVAGVTYKNPERVRLDGWFETPVGAVELMRLAGVKCEREVLRRGVKLGMQFSPHAVDMAEFRD